MKLMVSGIGGVGGYIASVLCENYQSVTLIARRRRKDALLKNGLILHSDFYGEHVSHPAVTDKPADAGIQDVVFVCVKNYSLPEALAALRPCIGEHTIVVLILNGVDHCRVAREILPGTRFVDSAIYITSAYQEDFSICQKGSFARIFIGGSDAAAVQQVYEILNHEGLTCRIAGNITAELWNKYITNCAYNVITSYYSGTIGHVFSQPKGKEEFYTLLKEAYAVGKKLGIPLDDSLPDAIFHRVCRQKNKQVTSSLARDIMHGRESELETFSGYLVKTARSLGMSIPFSEHCYDVLSRCMNTQKEKELPHGESSSSPCGSPRQ